MPANICGCARPVRIAAKSSFATSTALAIFCSASRRAWSITTFLASSGPPRRGQSYPTNAGLPDIGHLPVSTDPSATRSELAAAGPARLLPAGDDGADLLAVHDPGDVALLESEDHDRQRVVAGQADRGRVGDPEPPGQEVVVRQLVELHRVRVLLRVGVVDAVHALLAHQQRLGADLQRALGGDRVGGEVRHAGTGAEDHHPALLQVPLGLARDVRFGDLAHGDRGLHPGLDAELLQEVLERQAVHHRAEHAHVVGPVALHAALLQLGTTEEVAAADDHGDLHARPGDAGDLLGDRVHHVGVDAELAAAEHLTRQL